jgi:Arc/MetJ-type ribon-helix-helix transcriptional regulator
VASRTVRARLDDASEAALETLVREGRNESEAVRTALIEAADRRRRRSALAVEVRRLADDPDDTAERRALMEDMEAISADWPE